MSPALDDLRRAELGVKPPGLPFTPLLYHRASKARPLPTLSLRSSDSFRPGWRVDTYIAPGAFPRMQRNGTRPRGTPSPVAHRPAEGDRLDYEELLLDVLGEQVRTVSQPVVDVDDTAVKEQEQLYLAVNRYVPLAPPSTNRKKGGKGLTLVLCHGTGLHKETWEPVLQRMLDELEEEGHVWVEEIWALDAANQADSAVINEEVMGKGSNWSDLARDLLNFLLCYIDSPTLSSPSVSVAPPILDPSVADPKELLLNSRHALPAGLPLPSQRTFRNRTIVGIGHSSGASTLGLAAMAFPSIFSSLILLDPWILPRYHDGSSTDSPFFRSVALRRDSWNSREEAVESLTTKGFFQIWDKRITELFMQYGLRQLKDGRVALKTPAKTEMLMYANPYGWQGAYLFHQLQANPSLPVQIMLPSRGQSIVPETHLSAVIEGLPSVTFERVKRSSHLLPQMDPDRMGGILEGRLRDIYGRKAVVVEKL
ncbi:hypothetical protein JCM11641_007311 [Rhodosporidiobolus odoratus]